ncbi:ADL357Cp [Eremothecium gossypii ATCC 10895]|uniref:ADL357Cp n=1 Tax=Eremothecium gossypii (strain ATCC 10895 / CBS 109.51 / FGSC 9923 / NRRL Y-1056) TaxID=284811 RepID=Q75BC4_EREGS|nr:ADL357Cp [Eremothecium gossypii ATCC 10895]AAS51562.2 ADL357Cp [Eremothecium gossypii ATCC 10895]
MAFKTFKYKLYSKGYHSAAQKPATSFFDSSYQYLKQNQGLVSLDTAISQPFNGYLNPHPVVVAGVNYTNVQEVLELADEEGNRLREETEEAPAGTLTARPRALIRRNSDSFQFLTLPGLQKSDFNPRYSQCFYTSAAAPGDAEGLHTAAEPQPDVRFQEDLPPWQLDREPCLNEKTFLATSIKEIKTCMENEDYNKVNCIYQALKRNGIVPPVNTFEQVLCAIKLRDMDADDPEGKMVQLLNCYQDLVSNKLKPTTEIYTIVIGSLLERAATTKVLKEGLGEDFFKIALDLFFASNYTHTRGFNQELLDRILLGANLYPGHIKYSMLTSLVNDSLEYEKTEFYYISMINYARECKDATRLKALYDEFREATKSNDRLRTYQYEVYSMVVAGLVSLDSLEVAVKLLDRLLTQIRSTDGLDSCQTLVLSNFLLAVARNNPKTAYKLWTQFQQHSWVPEFSYEFYLAMLESSIEDMDVARNVYMYLYGMKPDFRKDPASFKEYLLYPRNKGHVLSALLHQSMQHSDKELINRLLEESICKRLPFKIDLYGPIFAYLKSIEIPPTYLLRFIECHGTLLTSLTGSEQFIFLQALVTYFSSYDLLKSVTEMSFFRDVCASFDITVSDTIPYNGLAACFEALWKAPQKIEHYGNVLELHALLITRIYDPALSQYKISAPVVQELKSKVTERFQKLASNFRRLHLDSTRCPAEVSQAVKIVRLPTETQNYFTNPGDWDKTYPLSLSILLSVDLHAGIREFSRLLKDGYCFDFETYKSLIHYRYVDDHVVSKSLELCPSNKSSKEELCDLLVTCTPARALNELILSNPSFQSEIRPYLSDSSLLEILRHCADIDFFITSVGFPENFKSIAAAAEFRRTIEYLYVRLLKSKRYTEIISFNKITSVLDLTVLMKACIRTGAYEAYLNLKKQFGREYKAELVAIHAEYLVNIFKFDEAVALVENAAVKTTAARDVSSFAQFIQSFSKEVKTNENVENTLQLANALCSLRSLEEMNDLYESVVSSKQHPLVDGTNIAFAVKLELLEQMLNNLHDALPFLDLKSEDCKKHVMERLNNYLLFRNRFHLPNARKEDLLQLMTIWSFVAPEAIDNLFNELVETLYASGTSPQKHLYVNDGFVLPCDRSLANTLVDWIKTFYQQEHNPENLIKVENFQQVLGNFYTGKDIMTFI